MLGLYNFKNYNFQKVVKDKYRLRNESFELDTDIATLLSFNYQWDTPENKKPELDAQSNEITMSRADFDGVLKMKLLSGTSIMRILI